MPQCGYSLPPLCITKKAAGQRRAGRATAVYVSQWHAMKWTQPRHAVARTAGISFLAVLTTIPKYRHTETERLLRGICDAHVVRARRQQPDSDQHKCKNVSPRPGKSATFEKIRAYLPHSSSVGTFDSYPARRAQAFSQDHSDKYVRNAPRRWGHDTAIGRKR